MSLDNWLGSFKPGFNPIPFSEKLRSSLAAMVSVLLMGEVLHFVPDGGHPLILFASMAAASVLLYALPHSPMSQPWPLLVGNLLSGLLGGAVRDANFRPGYGGCMCGGNFDFCNAFNTLTSSSRCSYSDDYGAEFVAD